MNTRRLLRATLLGSSIAVVACAAPVTVNATPSPAVVRISAFRFQPADLTVATGTTVTWTNDDAILHTVTTGSSVKKDDFGNYDVTADGRVAGELPDKGKTFSFTFATPGEYAYFCSRHNNMTGRVIVR